MPAVRLRGSPPPVLWRKVIAPPSRRGRSSAERSLLTLGKDGFVQGRSAVILIILIGGIPLLPAFAQEAPEQGAPEFPDSVPDSSDSRVDTGDGGWFAHARYRV